MKELRSRKREPQFRPKKRLGQHFLKDRQIIRHIIERACFQESDHVLEVGAGLGALTIPLAGKVRKITAVEKDTRLIDRLQGRLSNSDISNVVLINEDILRLDLKGIADGPEQKIGIIGNLPYNISSPLMEHLFRHRELIGRAVLMFQAEFARRLLSPPNRKDYGAITVFMRYNSTISPLLEVPREAFHPRPKVGSMVVSIDMERPFPRRAEDDAVFKAVVKAAFAHRRKTILNSLKDALRSNVIGEISEALERCSIDSMRRAESLDMDEFLCLAAAFKHHP